MTVLQVNKSGAMRKAAKIRMRLSVMTQKKVNNTIK